LSPVDPHDALGSRLRHGGCIYFLHHGRRADKPGSRPNQNLIATGGSVMADTIKGKMKEAGNAIGEAAKKVGNRVSEKAEQVKDWAKEKSHQAQNRADEAADRAADRTDEAKEDAKQKGDGCS
jgi:gas vesicle protein